MKSFLISDYDYDRPDYSDDTYEDYNSGFSNRQTEEEEYGGAIDYYDYESDENSDYDNELTCCLHSEILPDVVKEEGIEKCNDKFGFRCVRQDVSTIIYLLSSLALNNFQQI